jgi:hypothetical protein
MSFGAGPDGLLGPPRQAPAARAVFVPPVHPPIPMLGGGPEGIQRYLNPQYRPIGDVWQKIKIDKPTDT